MARFVIDSGATLYLAGVEARVPPEQELLAPTLWRSETLSALYHAVTRGDQQVGGLDVAMDEPGGVGGVEGAGHLGQDGDSGPGLHGARPQSARKVSSIH